MRKEEFRSALQMERKKVERAAYIMLGPRVNTWSAIMPAYCYTELCPDPEYRVNVRLSVFSDECGGRSNDMQHGRRVQR